MFEEAVSSPWQLLPDSVLLHIFSFIDAPTLLRSAQACKSWNRVACDEFLWRDLFYKDWKLSRSVNRVPGKNSWRCEYKRLKYHTPLVETEVLREHTNQVLHVSFSHNGEMFATSSKDGFIKVWNADYPASIRYNANMKEYGWKYTQFSQFNETDTLLLVSGVHTGPHSTSGEILVFSIDGELSIESKVLNKPYDIFGTWYNDTYLLSGQLLWLGHMVSSSVLWLNCAYQETDAPDKAVVTKLYKFYNKNASSIRTIMVANCLTEEAEGPSQGPCESGDAVVPSCMESVSNVRGNPLSHMFLNSERRISGHGRAFGGAAGAVGPAGSSPRGAGRLRRITDPDNLRDLGSASILLEDSWRDNDELYSESDDDDDDLVMFDGPYRHVDDPTTSTIPYLFAPNPNIIPTPRRRDPANLMEQEAEGFVVDEREKFLIFTTGSKTYTPHQIGFKRIRPFRFKDRISVSLPEKLAEQQERLLLEQSTSPNYQDELSVQHMFDKVDHLIDLHGHIIGMALSPDHRYLYVNNRPWPKNYVIENPLKPPPIAQEIDIHVIDLVTLKEVGIMLRSHKAYTPNDECFFIFLDVCDEFVASGAEDKHGYLWDRHYGICLAKFRHDDVVNSVAFNPVDSEMLITASDDYTLKIWRSRNRVREIEDKNGALAST